MVIIPVLHFYRSATRWASVAGLMYCIYVGFSTFKLACDFIKKKKEILVNHLPK